MSFNYSPKIVNDSSLVLYLDAANTKSYVSGSTTWNDISRTGNKSALVNGPNFNTSNSGNIVLDGTNDYIEVTDSITSTKLSPPIATFSIWFNPSNTAISNTVTSLISRGNYNTAGGFFIHMYNNVIEDNAPAVQALFSFSTTTSYSYDVTSIFVLPGFNVWSNVTVVCDTQISLYINGVHKQTVGRVADYPSIIYGNDAINTGGDTNLILCAGLGYAPLISNGYWEPYHGSISNMQMYNRRLSDTEILQNYNATKTRFGL
jgi:hypothetical protein